MRRVDQAPPLIDRQVIEQPAHRALAVGGRDFLDLRDLLGNVDVERHLLEVLFQRLEVTLVDGTDRVRGNTETRISADIFGCLFSMLRQLDIAVEIIAEAQLTTRKRPSVDAALRIGDGQQRQADTGGACRRGDPLRQLAEMGIGLATRLMVDIVKLGDAAVAETPASRQRQRRRSPRCPRDPEYPENDT